MADFSSIKLPERLKSQLTFLLEIDKLKGILRVTRLVGIDRRENSAEHSWHLAVMAMILREYAQDEVDIFRVIKMLLVHDLVEIYAGDAYCYDSARVENQASQEKQAADRLFTGLPEDQAHELRGLWDEFESRLSPEAQFAVALDRLMPLLHNFFTAGLTWKENRVTAAQVKRRMQPVRDGSIELGQLANVLIDASVELGFLDP